jgi:hypothetical protein
MESHPPPVPPPTRACLRCSSPATYFRAAAGVWRGFGIVRRADGAVVPLVPGREVPLCEDCGEAFDPRCVLIWDAPSWVVPVYGRRVKGG